jgi:hypothetical protein
MAVPEGLLGTSSRHVPRPRFARIARFARTQNRLSPILSNKASGCQSGTAIPASRWWLFFCPASRRSRDGGAGGIRTLDTAFQPYNGLANRRLQPLGHSTNRFFRRATGERPLWFPAGRGRQPYGHQPFPQATEGRPFALERRLAQGGLLRGKWPIPAAFCCPPPETAAARQR